MKIAFIGAGKMAEALVARLHRSAGIIISDVSRPRLALLSSRYRARAVSGNAEAFGAAAVVVLAVKPQNMADVLREIGSSGTGSRGKKLVISIAAGIPIAYLQKKLPGVRVIRAMPNNPALVGWGITALARGKQVSSKQSAVARKIFGGVGEVVEVPEKWLDAVTGLSGSGPAYIYEMIAALTAGGAQAGLPKKLAARLALQTVLGAAAAVKLTGRDPAALRAMVTSPGGTTIEGLKALDRRQFARAVREAVAAATRKSKLLSRKWAS